MLIVMLLSLPVAAGMRAVADPASGARTGLALHPGLPAVFAGTLRNGIRFEGDAAGPRATIAAEPARFSLPGAVRIEPLLRDALLDLPPPQATA